MKRFRAFITRYALLTYFALVFILSWGAILLITGPAGLPIPPEVAAESGPMIYMAMLVGPSIAGLLLISITEGRAGLRNLLSRLLRWRVGLRWYALALFTAPLTIVLAVLLLSLFSPTYLPAILTTDDKLAMLMTSLIAGVMVALFEEIGWTGFAVPRLRLRYSGFVTALIVGLVWGAWHFPPFWEIDTFGGGLPLLLLLVRLFAWLPAYRVLMVWLYDHTESLLLTMLMHATLVAAQFTLFPAALVGVTALVAILVWAVVLWSVVAMITMINHQQAQRALIALGEGRSS